MRFLPHTLIALIIAIQYPLWIGKGSWLRVWGVNQQLAEQKSKNTKLAQRQNTRSELTASPTPLIQLILKKPTINFTGIKFYATLRF